MTAPEEGRRVSDDAAVRAWAKGEPRVVNGTIVSTLARDLLDARSEIERLRYENEGAHKVLDLFDAPRTGHNPYEGTDETLYLAGRIQRLANPTNTEPLAVTVERLRVVVEAAERVWANGSEQNRRALGRALSALDEKPS